MLAAKSALGLRIDALSTWGVSSEDTSNEPTEEEKSQVGRDARLGIERRLRALEGKPLKSIKENANATALGAKKWDVKEARKYNPDADGLTGEEPAAKKSKTDKTNGTPKKLVQEVDSDEEMADADAGADDSDSSEEEEKSTSKDSSKAAKKAEKEAKKARKAERAAKREAKEAKKAAKEAKKASKDVKDADAKKKKKKSKD
jgi:nucleolar protein 58